MKEAKTPFSDASGGGPVRLAGVDGCRGGWIAAMASVRRQGRLGPVTFVARPSFQELRRWLRGMRFVAVDMPVGLPAARLCGGRSCDREARALLGRPRSSSVFSPPARPLLRARTFQEVRGAGISIQTFHLIPKIRELDGTITPRRQRRWFEAHPELVFMALMGRPMATKKKSAEGRRERLNVLKRFDPALAAAFREPVDRQPPAGLHVAADDRIDALALLACALRRRRGVARRLPDRPERDDRRLLMEIWF